MLFGKKKKNPASCYLKLVEGHHLKTEEKLYLCLKKYIFAIISFQGGTFSYAPEFLVQVCKPLKIAARWGCALYNKNVRAHFYSQFCVTLHFCFL